MSMEFLPTSSEEHSYDYPVPTIGNLFNLSFEYGGDYISVDEISKMASSHCLHSTILLARIW